MKKEDLLLPKDKITIAEDSVIEKARVKGCPKSPSESFISTELLIPLQNRAIADAASFHTAKQILEYLKEHGYIQFTSDEDLHLNYLDWRNLENIITELDSEKT